MSLSTLSKKGLTVTEVLNYTLDTYVGMGWITPKKAKEIKEENMAEVSKRYRINISTSVKGIKTYECTTDMLGASMDEVLKESDRLVAELDKRYPPPIEK